MLQMTHDRVKIKKGWVYDQEKGEGTKGTMLTDPFESPVTGQKWVVVIWDGDEDPSTVKVSALELL